ncbi:MAG: hypothetical protein [Lokiarchaeia virus VerdaV1]|uniref:Uncharacterized protein n=1 Tax=Lokiarchaeia virus VerdaV1 TaxID=3070170 RepID=A0AA35CPJ3_9CAUD|nr:MAG: hypothetical protein QIT41_gp44 [Lokiarchaeia virus VerdaV1]BDI54893.1 MAG: hypothetical protein [Lokiarchaeia virus VerdaV1]
MNLKQVLRKLVNWLDIWEETLWVMMHPKIRKQLWEAVEDMREGRYIILGEDNDRREE